MHRGADEREARVPREYRAKADKFDRTYCGTTRADQDAGLSGPLRRALDGFPEVRPLAFGGYGEAGSGVRRLIKALAFESASRRQRREDFNCTSLAQAQGVVAWWMTRRWGRMAVLTAAQVKDGARPHPGRRLGPSVPRCARSGNESCSTARRMPSGHCTQADGPGRAGARAALARCEPERALPLPCVYTFDDGGDGREVLTGCELLCCVSGSRLSRLGAHPPPRSKLGESAETALFSPLPGPECHR